MDLFLPHIHSYNYTNFDIFNAQIENKIRHNAYLIEQENSTQYFTGGTIYVKFFGPVFQRALIPFHAYLSHPLTWVDKLPEGVDTPRFEYGSNAHVKWVCEYIIKIITDRKTAHEKELARLDGIYSGINISDCVWGVYEMIIFHFEQISIHANFDNQKT